MNHGSNAKTFDQLSKDVRSKFRNSIEDYISVLITNLHIAPFEVSTKDKYIFVNALVERKQSLEDLMRVLGWSNLKTAQLILMDGGMDPRLGNQAWIDEREEAVRAEAVRAEAVREEVVRAEAVRVRVVRLVQMSESQPPMSISQWPNLQYFSESLPDNYHRELFTEDYDTQRGLAFRALKDLEKTRQEINANSTDFRRVKNSTNNKDFLINLTSMIQCVDLPERGLQDRLSADDLHRLRAFFDIVLPKLGGQMKRGIIYIEDETLRQAEVKKKQQEEDHERKDALSKIGENTPKEDEF